MRNRPLCIKTSKHRNICCQNSRDHYGEFLLEDFFISHQAFATISIQVPDNVIKYGNTDIDILCIVNGSSLTSTESIQLKRSNENIVSITKYGIFWQDKNLQNRGKINATIKNVHSSYLQLKISACNVNQTDEATYLCSLSAVKKDFLPTLPNSEEISLNITGFDDDKINKCGLSSHAPFAKGSLFLLMLNAIANAVLIRFQ